VYTITVPFMEYAEKKPVKGSPKIQKKPMRNKERKKKLE